ncbi:hypothetical protein P8C59_003795 [Phyllachora maydis]|uniref:TATA box binding protein associated factor (TAF) histone-like fold domain-containing protein n=1 Tax=Phyllachora maydis TaxID=1825666 RepID=A0AAD9I2G1_9PEZI|nr:hypothetical protein P8C59_003795 [Phyllachora maydis]
MATADPGAPKLLWNAESVKDVAESLGVVLQEEPLRILSQDVEYRIGQLLVEALRFMRAASRTTLTIQDLSLALRVLDVEPLYGYESTRPLRYGEASLGPGQPLFFVEDEELDFERLINAPLPKVPRDMTFSAHWLAIEGVQPSIPQNPTTAETSSKELLPKGPGANPALAALAGNDNVTFRPSVKHVISKELVLYFDKIQAAILDDDPDEEKARLRAAALESVRSDPGLHQLLPYFVNLITNQVTHRLDNTFVLRQMMDLCDAVIANPHLFIDPYASALAAPVLTCLLSRRLGPETAAADAAAAAAAREQYRLREAAASILGMVARKYSKSNAYLRAKLTRTCLKYFLDPARPPATLFGAINGLAATGGPETVRLLVLPNLRKLDDMRLQMLREKKEGLAALDFETLVGGIVKAIQMLAPAGSAALLNGVHANGNGNGNGNGNSRGDEVMEFLGPVVGERIAQLGNYALNRAILEARHIE